MTYNGYVISCSTANGYGWYVFSGRSCLGVFATEDEAIEFIDNL